MSESEKIGHRIKKARGLAGLSQTDFALLVGVSRGLVGQWESHRKMPGRERLIAIAKAASVSTAFLLGQERLDALGLTTADAEEMALLRGFRRLNEVQRKNLLQLIGISANIRKEIEQERRPAKAEPVA